VGATDAVQMGEMAGAKRWHSPASNAEVKNEWNYTSFPPHMSSWHSQGQFLDCLTLQLKVLQSLPMLVTVYQSSQHNITEDLNCQQHFCQNLTCHSCDHVVLVVHTPSFDILRKRIGSVAAQQWYILQ